MLPKPEKTVRIYRLWHSREKAAELGSKAAKAENLPSIAFTGGYVAADIPKFLTVYNAINVGIRGFL